MAHAADKSVSDPNSNSSYCRETIDVSLYGHEGGPHVSVDVRRFATHKDALVGVFDILGFKAIMKQSEADPLALAGRIKLVGDWIRGSVDEKAIFTVRGKRSHIEPELLQVSDTFVVFAKHHSLADVIQFFWNIHHMLFYSIILGMPLRGAVSRGCMVSNGDERLFFGPAVHEALSLERAQQWAGACVASSLWSYLNNEGMIDALYPLLLPWKIPWKGEKQPIESNLAINWVADAAHFLHPAHLPSKFPPAEDSDNVRVRQKIEHTRQFLEHALDHKQRIGAFLAPENRHIEREPLNPTLPDGPQLVRFILDDEDPTAKGK